MRLFKSIFLLCYSLKLFSQCPPHVTISVLSQTLTCFNPTMIATGSSTTANTVITWLVPENPPFVNSNTIEIGPNQGVILPPGTPQIYNYTVVATNTLLSCTTQSVIKIYQNFKPPISIPSIVGTTSTLCQQNPILLTSINSTVTSGVPGASIQNAFWIGPSPQTPSLSNSYIAFTPGIYTLTTEDSFNGCSYYGTINIGGNFPNFGLQGTAPTSSASCNGSLIVTTQIPNGYSLSATSGSLNGTTINNLCYGWVKVCMTYTDTQCFKCDSILMNAATSLNEINLEDEISIYPNPTSSSFFIKNTSNKNVSVKIFDLEGRKIEHVASRASATETSTEMEIKNLAPGIYFIEVRSENSVLRKKLLVRS